MDGNKMDGNKMDNLLSKLVKVANITGVIILMSTAAYNVAIGSDRSAAVNLMGVATIYLVAKL